nr:hypothetical protein [Oscillospiraceae bacterium]
MKRSRNDTLQYIYTLSTQYEKQGLRVKGVNMPIRDYAQFAVMKFMLYMTDSDRQIKDYEVEIINSCLGFSLSKGYLSKFLENHKISADAIFETIVALLMVFLNADMKNQEKNGSTSLILLEFLDELGLEFITYDGMNNDRQIKAMGLLMLRLKNYRMAYIRSWKKSHSEQD